MNLKKIYKKEQFNPGIIGFFINPFYFSRKNLFKGIKELSNELKGRILDVGCGKKPYKDLFEFKEYIGLDIENGGHNHKNEDIDVFYDGKKFPFENDSFDSVLSNQVLEHVFNPEYFLSEIKRVLKKNGKVLITVPFLWGEHEKPNDYGRYTSFGLKHILEKEGFEILEYKKSTVGFVTLLQLYNALVFEKIKIKNKKLKYFFVLIFTMPSNLLGIFFDTEKGDLYLDSIILARKK